jgi:hypothetical protein
MVAVVAAKTTLWEIGLRLVLPLVGKENFLPRWFSGAFLGAAASNPLCAF